MNSSHQSTSTLEPHPDTLSGRRLAGLLTRLPGLGRFFGRSKRLRPSALSYWRLGLMSAAVLFTVSTVTWLVVTWSLSQALSRAADGALAYVESQLQAVDAQGARMISAVSLHAGSDLPPQCHSELVERLLHESLESAHVRRWMVQDIDTGLACDPQGRTASLSLPSQVPWQSALLARQTLAPQAMVLRRIDVATVLAAILDDRTLGLPSSGPWASAIAKGAHIELVTSDGRALPAWGQRKDADRRDPSIHVHARSEFNGFAVKALFDDNTVLHQVLLAWPWVLFNWLAFTGLIGFLAWLRLVKRARLVNRIDRALAKRQFEPFIQPIFSLSTGECIGGEILMRWAHPQRGILGPGEFINEAERTGLIIGMSHLIMSRASFRLSSLAQANPNFYFSFNVTTKQLRQPNFAQQLGDLFRHDSLPPHQVLLELTEREIVDPSARSTLLALNAAGWRLAVDDFGTGHSSLATLESLPISRLKIDRAFVSTIGELSANRPVLDAIIGMSRDLGIKLIAEGIESEAQWNYLAERGVGAAQGFLMARPMSLDAFESWLETHQANRLLDTSPREVATVPGPLVAEPPRPKPHHDADRELALLCTRMLSIGGIDLRDRMYHLRSYRQCFIAREAVDWIAREQRVSRTEAVRIGRRMVALGLVRHVRHEHDFADQELYFVPTVAQASQLASLPPMQPVAQALMSLNEGVALGDQRRGLLVHHRVVTGRAIVNWLVRKYDISRDAAVQWASQMMREGRVRHIFDDRAFQDSRELYRLK